MSEIVLAFAIAYHKIYGEQFFNNVHALIDFRDLLKDVHQDDIIHRSAGTREDLYMNHIQSILPIVCDKYDVANHSEFKLNGFARTITNHQGDVSFQRTFSRLIEKRLKTFRRDSLMLMFGLAYIYPSVKDVVYLYKWSCKEAGISAGDHARIESRDDLHRLFKGTQSIMLQALPDDQ